MISLTKFYLVRHGETNWVLSEHEVDGYKFKGHGRDLAPLTEKGVLQAKELARDMRIMRAEIIISSPYTRALQTAAIISKETGVDLKVEIDLREWQPDLGFEYDSPARLNELCADYQRHDGIYPVGETRPWESKEQLRKRMDRVLEQYLGYSSVTVVTHEEIIRTLNNIDGIPYGSILEFVK